MNEKVIYPVFAISIFSIFAYINKQLEFDVWQAVVLLTAQTTLLVCFAIYTFLKIGNKGQGKSKALTAGLCILVTIFLTAFSTKYIIDAMAYII